ncbi:MAG TPA: acyl-CoA dehydrogenase family protein [Mycobacteriales bacterium]|nr:acyl-CoA dehydrogenase family protein [Mycobacteriales bacterium]
MDFRLGEKSDALRAQTKAFLDDVLTPEMLERCYRTGTNHDVDFARALAEAGLLALDWSPELGGGGHDGAELVGYREEMQRRNAPIYAVGTTMTVSHVIALMGTPAQRDEIVPKSLRGEVVIALGFTEPENGSDAAAAATRAERSGDGWRINGSKMFTTNAQIADYVFMLARTNPEAPKHRGLTTFLVPLEQDGVEVQEVRTMSGERTNITFYNDVYVDDAWRIGDVDGGWNVMGAAFMHEHSAAFVGEQIRLVEAFGTWAQEATDDEGRPRAQDPAIRERLGRSHTEIEVSLLLQRRAVTRGVDSMLAHGRGSMAKLFSTERLEAQADQTLELVGADGLRAWGDPTTLQGGEIEHAVRNAKGTTIYAGTSEIQRNIIAQHVLGLPRPY